MENNESRDRTIIKTLAETFRQMDSLKRSIEKAAGFNMPIDTEKRFVHLSLLVEGSTDADLLKGLNQEWQKKFKIIASIEEGLAASYYHLNNISLIEREVISQALDKALIVRPEFFVTGIEILNTRRLDFEYQALILSLRRTLDYLAISTGAFFKRECNSIRKLSKTSIKDADPEEIRSRIISKLEEKLKALPELVSLEGDRSAVRDAIAHRFPVGAGTLNILYTQDMIITISFVGGGEKVFPWDPGRKKEIISGGVGQRIGVILLTPTLQALLLEVENLVFDIYRELGFES
jgi:hypothetical protein